MRFRLQNGLWTICLACLVIFLAEFLFHKYVMTLNVISERSGREGVLKAKEGLDGLNENDRTKLRDTSSDSLKEVDRLKTKMGNILSVGTKAKQSDDQDFSEIDYHGRDLMQDPPKVFDKHFKNPCWWEEQNLRCLPYMFVLGVKKCGTTDLFFRLSQHPDFYKPGFKEAQFFARKRFSSKTKSDNISVYIEMFDKAASGILSAAETGEDGQLFNNRTITGEGSPSNLHLNSHWRHLPGNEGSDEPKFLIVDYIHHFIPDAKIIITFRNPLERLYSDYYHEYGSLHRVDDPDPHHFHSVVENGLKLYRDCFKTRTVRSCVYDPTFYDETKIQIQLGIFYIFWKDLIRVFRRDQILVLQNKDLRDKKATTKKVFEFLGLRPLDEDEMQKVIDAKDGYPRKAQYVAKGPMLNETFRLLQDFYAPFNREMADITGDIDFLYGVAKDQLP